MAPRTRPHAKWLTTLLACGLGALIAAGAAGAANSASFADPSGDAGLTPDITRLDISTDGAGTVTFQLTYTGGLTLGLPGEEFGVALDLDQNPDTGSIYYGTEVALMFEGGALKFLRANGAGFFVAATPPPSLQGTLGDSTPSATISVKAAELGLAPNAGFNVFTESYSAFSGSIDVAPEIRTFNYQPVAGTPPPALGPDRRAPSDKALASRGTHGKVAKLDYVAADGRGVTADTIWVYNRGRLAKTLYVSLGDASPLFVYDMRWRVPANVRGRLRFCVRSVDAAGNKSNRSCAAFIVR